MADLAHACKAWFEVGKKKAEALVIGLYGDLGAGKTAFVKELAKTFGVKEHITSPTFVLMKKYPLENAPFDYLIHIDAYRLQNGEELAKLGWKEIICNPCNLVCIEWPEKVSEVMPKHHEMKFRFVDEGTREVSV